MAQVSYVSQLGGATLRLDYDEAAATRQLQRLVVRTRREGVWLLLRQPGHLPRRIEVWPWQQRCVVFPLTWPAETRDRRGYWRQPDWSYGTLGRE